MFLLQVICQTTMGDRMHVDLIINSWCCAKQNLVERVEVDDPRAKWTGDYLFASEPHEEDECPFKENRTIEMFIRNT